MKRTAYRLAILIIGVMTGVLAATAGGQTAQSFNQTPTLEIPSGVENAVYDSDVNRSSPLFLSIARDGKIYLRKISKVVEVRNGREIKDIQNILLTDANFIGEMNKYWNDNPKSPDRNWIYIKADVAVKFGNLTAIFRKSAMSEIAPRRVQFVVDPRKEIAKSEQTPDGGYVLTLVLPEKNLPPQKSDGSEKTGEISPPPPLPPGNKPPQKSAGQAEARKKIKIEKLFVEMESAEKYKFNSQQQTVEELPNTLKKIFDERAANEFYRPGTNEIDNTVYLKIAPNVNYGAAIKLIDEIYGLGANLIIFNL